MDLRTFRRAGPGLAECESQAAWRRLWADRRAHRSRDTRGPVSNVAASWPQCGYRGPNPPTTRTLAGHRGLERVLSQPMALRWRRLMASSPQLVGVAGHPEEVPAPERHGRTTHLFAIPTARPQWCWQPLDVQRFRRSTGGACRTDQKQNWGVQCKEEPARGLGRKSARGKLIARG
jgi:hypothetical protein